MTLKDAYSLACNITTQYLRREISKTCALQLFAVSKVVVDLPLTSRDIAKIALTTLLQHSEMPPIAPTRAVEDYTPQIRIPNPSVKRGFSVAVIDGSQARSFVLADARCISVV